MLTSETSQTERERDKEKRKEGDMWEERKKERKKRLQRSFDFRLISA